MDVISTVDWKALGCSSVLDSVLPKRLKKSLKVGGSSCPISIYIYIYIYIYIVSGSLIECIIIKLFDPIKIIN
jgi:hypothetical protein